jgi:hypothetical protein
MLEAHVAPLFWLAVSQLDPFFVAKVAAHIALDEDGKSGKIKDLCLS